METVEARKIIRNLADGIDPVTGEVFPMDSPYQHPQVIRSLYAALATMDRQKKARQVDPSRSKAGSPWTNEEEAQLIDAFDSGMHIDGLAKIHSRTPAAITARLEKLGKIEAGGSQEATG